MRLSFLLCTICISLLFFGCSSDEVTQQTPMETTSGTTDDATSDTDDDASDNDDATSDTDDDATNGPTTTFLKKVTTEVSGISREFIYDSQKRVHKLIDQNSVEAIVVSYANSTSSMVELLTYHHGGFENVTYSANNTITLVSSSHNITTVINYSEDGYIDYYKKIYSDGDTDEIVFTRDSDNNIVTDERLTNSILISTTTYSNFDDKDTPGASPVFVQYLPEIFNLKVSKNNPSTMVIQSSSGLVSNFSYSYEYDSNGKVTKRIHYRPPNLPSVTNTYEYIEL